MSGHVWKRIGESEVRATGARTKKQWLWLCERCKSSTIVDEELDPEKVKDLYHMEPREYDGTTVVDPPILSCEEEIYEAALKALKC